MTIQTFLTSDSETCKGLSMILGDSFLEQGDYLYSDFTHTVRKLNIQDMTDVAQMVRKVEPTIPDDIVSEIQEFCNECKDIYEIYLMYSKCEVCGLIAIRD